MSLILDPRHFRVGRSSSLSNPPSSGSPFALSLFLPLYLFRSSLSPSPSLCRGLVPLHNACSYGHYEVAELLVRHGASVNVADLWKFTPLHEAAAKGKYEICKLLLKVCPATGCLKLS